jgi:hypothetical protein
MVKSPESGREEFSHMTDDDVDFRKPVEHSVDYHSEDLTLVEGDGGRTCVATPVANWKDAPRRAARSFQTCSNTGASGPLG